MSVFQWCILCNLLLIWRRCTLENWHVRRRNIRSVRECLLVGSWAGRSAHLWSKPRAPGVEKPGILRSLSRKNTPSGIIARRRKLETLAEHVYNLPSRQLAEAAQAHAQPARRPAMKRTTSLRWSCFLRKHRASSCLALLQQWQSLGALTGLWRAYSCRCCCCCCCDSAHYGTTPTRALSIWNAEEAKAS